MEFDWIWKAILIVVAGTFLLRFAGRKSIAQMTLAQTVIMVAIGSLLIQPVAGKNVWTTIAVGGVLVFTLFLMEYAQVKVDWIEKIITGKAKVLIENGTIKQKNLRKMRLTVDQLEMKMRQKNVTKLSDVQWATLEPNGQLGFVLKQDSQPVTQKQFQQLTNDLQQIQTALNQIMSLYVKTPQMNQQPVSQSTKPAENQADLFTEVDQQAHPIEPPKHLQ